MRIGITERGDAGVDLSWTGEMQKVDGAILITKNVNDRFIEAVAQQKKPIIVHGTCTGFGKTLLEPNVIPWEQQIRQMKKLAGIMDPGHIVLRIDPIFPVKAGIQVFHRVMDTYLKILRPLGVQRIRISIFDEYNHVKRRLVKNGWEPLYRENKYASKTQIEDVAKALGQYASDITFETCAENMLVSKCVNAEITGCISGKDLAIMGLSVPKNCGINPQNRYGCCCLSCKTELLKNRKQCPHKCIYCYWK